jgi:hypothetical protein
MNIPTNQSLYWGPFRLAGMPWKAKNMRSPIVILVAFVISVLPVVSPERAQALPYDPYPWCAVYSGDGGGGTNCGFLTTEQCRATVSGIGGFCAPNQFYNPRASARPSKRSKGQSQPNRDPYFFDE